MYQSARLLQFRRSLYTFGSSTNSNIGSLANQIATIYLRGNISYFGVYPNGKMANSTDFKLAVCGYNPKYKSGTIAEAYVYDSNGSFTDIKSALSITAKWYGYEIVGTFNASHAGKLLRIEIYTSP